MFACDDKHPDDLLKGHINLLVKRAIAKGYDLWKVLYAACIHPNTHYKMRTGLLRKGDPADFIICEDLKEFKVRETVIDGVTVAKDGKSLWVRPKVGTPNNFNIGAKKLEEFKLESKTNGVRVIKAIKE